MRASVFEDVPMAGRWGTAILLDGNVGIGGEPLELFTRISGIVRRGGRILVELDQAEGSTDRELVRIVVHDRPGPWFPWCSLAAHDLGVVAGQAALTVAERWDDGGRAFADLRTP